jgi:hypothetical protein
MLGHLEADWAVAPLAEVLHDENELVWRTARAALKHIGTPEALAALEAVPEPEPALPTIATTPVHAVPSAVVTAEKVADSTPASSTPEPESSSPTPACAERPKCMNRLHLPVMKNRPKRLHPRLSLRQKRRP